jgi:hypothetical protein
MTAKNGPEDQAENVPGHADGICVHFQRAADLLGQRWSTLIVSAMLAGASGPQPTAA